MGLVNRKSAKVTGEIWLDGEELLDMPQNEVRKLTRHRRWR